MKNNTLFLITSRSIVFRIKNILNKFVEKSKTHFMFSNLFLWAR